MSLVAEFSEHSENWLRDFTGREWLVPKVRGFLDDPQASYFLLITGESGIGKSTFAAYLWQHELIPDAVHFCIGGKGGTTEPLRFIQSVAEQLGNRLPGFGQALIEAQKAFADHSVVITAIQHTESVQGGQVIGIIIQHLEIRDLPPETAFDRVVRCPLRALDETGNLQQVVILVDALDEAVVRNSHPNIAEILAQAQDLPAQVRFILTSRPDPQVEILFAEQHHIAIEAQSPENQEDITHYLSHYLQQDERLRQALANAGWNEAQFVEDLGEIGEGNFLYLSLVLPDIAAGRFHLGEDILPRGLDGYYQYLLGTRLGLGTWKEWGADLMEVVLALQEPASLEQIAAYLGWPERQTYGRLGQVSQLLDLSLREQKLCWRHHWSIANFLSDRERAKDFWCDERQGHARIANFYLAAWGGLEVGLPGLQEPNKRELHSRYGLHHLTRHLTDAGHERDLWSLLAATPNWLTEQARHDPSRRQYAWDLEAAISLSERGGVDRLPEVVAYSLLYATTGSQVTRVPSEMLGLMTSLGQTKQALRFAELVTSPERQSEAYVEISEQLLADNDVAKCVEVLALAREVAMQISEEGNRASALSKVAHVLGRAGKKETARSVLGDALEAIASKTYGIGEASIDIAETAISIGDSDALSKLLPIAVRNEEGGSTSRGQFFCRLAVALGKARCRDELVRFLELDPLSRISESKAFTLAWIAFGFTLAGDTESAGRLFDEARSMAEHKDDYSPTLTVGDELEVAILAAKAYLGDVSDPSNILSKATHIYDFRAHQVLHEVVQVMIRNGNLEGIWSLAELLLDFRVELLCYYARESVRLGKPDEAERALKRALQAIDEFTERYYADWRNRVRILRLVVEATVELGYGQFLEEALDVAERTKDYYGHDDYHARTQALALVARALVRFGNKQRAQQVLVDLLQLPQSAAAAVSVSEVRAWSHLMLALANSGDMKKAREAAQKAMRDAEIVGTCDDVDVIEGLVTVAQGFAQMQDRVGLADLLSCVRRIKGGDYSRGEILIGIARAMSQIDDRPGLVKVVTAAANIHKDASPPYGTDAASFRTLVGVAPILGRAGNMDGLLHVVAAAQDIDESAGVTESRAESPRWDVYGFDLDRARDVLDRKHFADVITTVGLALIRMGEPEQAGEILSRVPWQDVLWLKRTWDCLPDAFNLSIYNMAQALALTGQVDQALKLAEYIEASTTRDLVAEPDEEYLAASDGHPSRDETYLAVASAWLSGAESRFDQEETLQAAIEAVARIEGSNNRFHGLMALSQSLANAGARPQAHKVLDAALQVAETIQDREQRSWAVITAAEALAQIGEIRQACEILAKAEDLARGIEDSEVSVRVLGFLAEALVQAGELSRAQEVIPVAVFQLMIATGLLERLGSDPQGVVDSYVRRLIWFADLHVQMGEISQARELISLAFEATERIKDESTKASLLIKQARALFRINDSEEAHRVVLSALEAFQRSGYRASFKPDREYLEYIVELLAENTDGCSQDTLLSVLMNGFQFARSHGRDEVLEHIAVFAASLVLQPHLW